MTIERFFPARNGRFSWSAGQVVDTSCSGAPILFGGRSPQGAGSKDKPVVAEPTQGIEFLTPPFSLDRQLELDFRYLLSLKSNGHTDEVIEAVARSWPRDHKKLVHKERFHQYLHYIGQVWCKDKARSWDADDIIALDNVDYDFGNRCHGAFVDLGPPIPVVKDLHDFLQSGGRIDGNVGADLEDCWFVKVYAHKHHFLSLIDKERIPFLRGSRIQYKYSIGRYGMCAFLHHLMLWEVEFDKELKQGAPYVSMRPTASHMAYRYPPYREFPTFVADGKTGHVIYVLYWNVASRRFVFLDSWPRGSFLERMNDVAIFPSEKVEENTGDELYEIDSEQLSKIIAAVFIPVTPMFDLLRYGTETKYLFIPWEGR